MHSEHALAWMGLYSGCIPRGVLRSKIPRITSATCNLLHVCAFLYCWNSNITSSPYSSSLHIICVLCQIKFFQIPFARSIMTLPVYWHDVHMPHNTSSLWFFHLFWCCLYLFFLRKKHVTDNSSISIDNYM